MTPTVDTIVAPATGSGGAIAVIRLSGPESIAIADSIFESRAGKGAEARGRLSAARGFTMHYGNITSDGGVLDDVILSLFRAPRSYTGEDMVEISCHASPFIISEILRLCTERGARAAAAGEFTMRAFMNGRMDLSQSEAVAEIIAADSRAAHAIASRQLRDGYSSDFSALRTKLVELASLLELELDFSEEDVEFADRTRLAALLDDAGQRIGSLLDSFRLGNIVRSGVPVAIVGKPNVGKSTLLNALLNDEKALVSDIAGTTRDTVEDTVNIGGVTFRFIDTAGLRHSTDPIEKMGIERTRQSIAKAVVVMLVADPAEEAADIAGRLRSFGLTGEQHTVVVLNKSDRHPKSRLESLTRELNAAGVADVIAVSAKNRSNLDAVTEHLTSAAGVNSLFDDGKTIVFNARHRECLSSALDAVERAGAAMRNGLPADLLAEEVNEIIHHVSLVTGDITSQDVLNSIFSRFCVGK